jgi:hypothetical protein
VVKLKKEDLLEHLEIDGMVILKWNLTFRGPCIVIYSYNIIIIIGSTALGGPWPPPEVS